MSAYESDTREIIDLSIPHGENYNRAEFRLWLPDESGELREGSGGGPWLQLRLSVSRTVLAIFLMVSHVVTHLSFRNIIMCVLVV